MCGQLRERGMWLIDIVQILGAYPARCFKPHLCPAVTLLDYSYRRASGKWLCDFLMLRAGPRSYVEATCIYHGLSGYSCGLLLRYRRRCRFSAEQPLPQLIQRKSRAGISLSSRRDLFMPNNGVYWIVLT